MALTRRTFVRFLAGIGFLALPAVAALPRQARRRVVEAVRGATFPGRVVILESHIRPGYDLAG